MATFGLFELLRCWIVSFCLDVPHKPFQMLFEARDLSTGMGTRRSWLYQVVPVWCVIHVITIVWRILIHHHWLALNGIIVQIELSKRQSDLVNFLLR